MVLPVEAPCDPSMSQQLLGVLEKARIEQSVGKVGVKPRGDTVQVWEDEKHSRKITVPKLDPELLAKSLKQRLSLHLTYYSFGPEITWARKTGIQYDEAAQLLVVKYKQLCVDYNAGLVSQESYHQRRREIDAAAERASKVREEMFQFMRRLSREAFADLDRHVDLLKELRPK